MRHLMLAAGCLIAMALLVIVLARAQESSPGAAPTIHVPIVLPSAVPPRTNSRGLSVLSQVLPESRGFDRVKCAVGIVRL